MGSLIPARFEYLFVLVLFLWLIVALFPFQVGSLIRRREYWTSQALFFVIATLLDLVAIELGWWIFSDSKVLGVYWMGLPLEEYVLFIIFHLATCASWEAMTRELA